MHLIGDIFNCITQSLSNTLLLPDTIQVDLSCCTMTDISKGVCHYISPITAKFLCCHNLFCLTKQDSFSNKAMEVSLINLKISSFLQTQCKLGETLLRTLADYVRQLFPCHFKFR